MITWFPEETQRACGRPASLVAMAGDDDRGPATDALPTRATPLPERLRLLVVAGPDQGAAIALSRGTYEVGKDEGCALVLTDGSVSRRHLALEVGADGVVVRDLESRNGSFFQGARFSQVTIGVGEVVSIGATQLRLSPADAAIPMLPSSRDRFGQLIGPSLVMRELFALLERVAQSDVSVLIEGETGTGKELCAEALHAASNRKGGPFVVCDLAGVSRNLIESELFGHRKGAFTGADRDREGAFAQAHGGTIFIDELGELELDAQPRLLRALAQKRIKPVGAAHYVDVDVRVIAATNRDLLQECSAGRFRADLYHRLAVVRATIPPLRARKEDLPALVAELTRDRDVTVPPETLALLREYDWPGNVRELRNRIERMLSLVGPDRTLTPSLLGLESSDGRSADVLAARVVADERFREAKERLIDGWERAYLSDLLKRAEGNVSEAARRSGLDRAYLHRLLRKHALGGGGAD